MAQTTVLIVDDTEDVRTIHGILLKRLGYRVLEAHNGSEAVRLASERHPDAILMDLGLPVLDGWGAIEALRADPDTAGIPVIVVSSDDDPSSRERASAAGCDFLSKPCRENELAASVAHAVGERPPSVRPPGP
ncbi:MAG TPA: response regulator [Longimicrobiales bacterium]|nr:response regulator [Longimicrobiales bacterium]